MIVCSISSDKDYQCSLQFYSCNGDYILYWSTSESDGMFQSGNTVQARSIRRLSPTTFCLNFD